jgi:hypothetical protein
MPRCFSTTAGAVVGRWQLLLLLGCLNKPLSIPAAAERQQQAVQVLPTALFARHCGDDQVIKESISLAGHFSTSLRTCTWLPFGQPKPKIQAHLPAAIATELATVRHQRTYALVGGIEGGVRNIELDGQRACGGMNACVDSNTCICACRQSECIGKCILTTIRPACVVWWWWWGGVGGG